MGKTSWGASASPASAVVQQIGAQFCPAAAAHPQPHQSPAQKRPLPKFPTLPLCLEHHRRQPLAAFLLPRILLDAPAAAPTARQQPQIIAPAKIARQAAGKRQPRPELASDSYTA